MCNIGWNWPEYIIKIYTLQYTIFVITFINIGNIMIEIKYPNNKFREYINFISKYCVKNNLTLILKGSLAENNACEYSDIDLVIFGKLNKNNIYEIIYNYNNPLLINLSTNPKGMLITTYENDISVDLDIRKTIIAEDIIPENKILVNNGVNLSKSIISYRIKISDYCKNHSKKLFEILKLIIKGTNKYLSIKEKVANDILIEIKEKCKKYFGINNLDYNNNYKHDVQLIYNELLNKYDIDRMKKIYFNKLLRGNNK
jgi:hypothetical protein